MISKRRIFAKLARAFGPLHSVADFLDLSTSSVERRINSGGRIHLEHEILPLEDDRRLYPWTIERFRQALQGMNNDARLSDEVETIHAALMRIKAKAPEQFDVE